MITTTTSLKKPDDTYAQAQNPGSWRKYSKLKKKYRIEKKKQYDRASRLMRKGERNNFYPKHKNIRVRFGKKTKRLKVKGPCKPFSIPFLIHGCEKFLNPASGSLLRSRIAIPHNFTESD